MIWRFWILALLRARAISPEILPRSPQLRDIKLRVVVIISCLCFFFSLNVS